MRFQLLVVFELLVGLFLVTPDKALVSGSVTVPSNHIAAWGQGVKDILIDGKRASVQGQTGWVQDADSQQITSFLDLEILAARISEDAETLYPAPSTKGMKLLLIFESAYTVKDASEIVSLEFKADGKLTLSQGHFPISALALINEKSPFANGFMKIGSDASKHYQITESATTLQETTSTSEETQAQTTTETESQSSKTADVKDNTFWSIEPESVLNNSQLKLSLKRSESGDLPVKPGQTLRVWVVYQAITDNDTDVVPANQLADYISGVDIAWARWPKLVSNSASITLANGSLQLLRASSSLVAAVLVALAI